MLFHSQELQVIVIFKRRFYLLFLCFYVIFIKLLCNFLIFFEKSIALTLKLLYNQFVFDFRDGFAQLAQSVEHVTVNHRVVGSSPTLSAILCWPVGEVVQHTCLSRMHSWVQIPYGSPNMLKSE